MDDKDRLIERIEQADDRFLRLTARDRSNPLLSVDLTMQQLRTLMILSFQGSASGQELAAGLGVHLATVTGIVNRLAARGLVGRREDPADRRVRRVRLTQHGVDLIDQIRNAGRQHKRRLLTRLDEPTLRQMIQAMDALNAAAEAEAAHQRVAPSEAG